MYFRDQRLDQNLPKNVYFSAGDPPNNDALTATLKALDDLPTHLNAQLPDEDIVAALKAKELSAKGVKRVCMAQAALEAASTGYMARDSHLLTQCKAGEITIAVRGFYHAIPDTDMGKPPGGAEGSLLSSKMDAVVFIDKVAEAEYKKTKQELENPTRREIRVGCDTNDVPIGSRAERERILFGPKGERPLSSAELATLRKGVSGSGSIKDEIRQRKPHRHDES